MIMKSLVERLEDEGYLKTPNIIEAFRSVDRRDFVLQRGEAYQDHPLPIPDGQTISAPHMVAIMLELLEPNKSDRVLEIGAGSGYNAAIVSRLVKKVVSLEVDKTLVDFAKENLKKAKIKNVKVVQGDGSEGLPKKRWDKIIITCAVPQIPGSLVDQLKDPGILMAPVGEGFQELVVLRKENSEIKEENHGGCVFVPLRESQI